MVGKALGLVATKANTTAAAAEAMVVAREAVMAVAAAVAVTVAEEAAVGMPEV